MSCHLLAGLCVLMPALALYAQKGFRLGGTVAVTSAWILPQNNARTLEDYPDIAQSELAYRLKFGYQIAGILAYQFHKNYGLQTQIAYERTGQNYEDNFTPQAGPLHVIRQIDLRYLSLPLLFAYTSSRGKIAKGYALAGIQCNFLTRAHEEVYLNGLHKTDSLTAWDKFRHFDVGFALGGGAFFYATPYLSFHIGLYHYVGLRDINSAAVRHFISKNDKTYTASKNLRGGLQVGIHYFFPSRKNPWHPALR